MKLVFHLTYCCVHLHILLENPDSGIGFTSYAVTRVIKHRNMSPLAEQRNLNGLSFWSIKVHFCPFNQLLRSSRGSQRNVIDLKMTY